MVGIAGLLAKRKQAAVSTPVANDDSNRAASSSSLSANAMDINNDLHDPFSFDERPSTSCSFGFTGTYMDANSFDTYDDVDTIARGGRIDDGRCFGEVGEDPSAAIATAPAEKDIELFSMPPPPPRPVFAPDQTETPIDQTLPSTEAMVMPNHGPHEDLVQEAVEQAPARDGVEGFVMTDDTTRPLSAEIDDCQHDQPAPARPSTDLDTPAKVTTSPAVVAHEPYGSPTAFECTFQTPLPTVTPPAHAHALSLGARASRSDDIQQVTPNSNDSYVSGQDEGFDDMHVRFLHDLQGVKDKHLDGEEHMLEMEVYLDHVIAAINTQILQMQEIHDELDEIEDTQDVIIAMHRE